MRSPINVISIQNQDKEKLFLDGYKIAKEN